MNKPTTPYFRGARAALFFGPYLSVIFLSLVMQLAWLQSIGSLLILGLPIATFVALRRSYIASGYRQSFSEIWVEGIAMYFFGCAICALVTMVYLKWIDPDVLMRLTQAAVEGLRQVGSPEYKEMARVLDNAIAQGVVLNAKSFVISMFWMTMALGCTLSLASAAFIKMFVKQRKPATPGNWTSPEERMER